jgi:hypothetical protein
MYWDENKEKEDKDVLIKEFLKKQIHYEQILKR